MQALRRFWETKKAYLAGSKSGGKYLLRTLRSPYNRRYAYEYPVWAAPGARRDKNILVYTYHLALFSFEGLLGLSGASFGAAVQSFLARVALCGRLVRALQPKLRNILHNNFWYGNAFLWTARLSTTRPHRSEVQ
jgi:hypothetical protein